jgi:excinuclease ABC subunit A
MAKTSAAPVIRLRGVRHNNLKNFDLDLPQNRLIVVTGLSGSGKSSLAFDTLFAEGQRRYIETFSPYARQFFDRMDKPQVDSIEGIPPAIAIEQRNSVRSTRSTVGTMTEICDYMKLLWPRVAQLHCRQCGRPVRKDSPHDIWKALTGAAAAPAEVLVTFSVPVAEKLSLDESLGLISKQGYQRLLVNGEILRLEDAAPRLAKEKPASLTVIQDRLKLAPASRSRFVEACEQAFHFGKGKLAIIPLGSATSPQHEPTSAATSSISNRYTKAAANGRAGQSSSTKYPAASGEVMIAAERPPAAFGSDESLASDSPPRTPHSAIQNPLLFSNRLHCSHCDIEYREPSPALFSFNHPLGACPACRGFGRIITIDYDLALPDRSKSLAQGVVRPWQTGQSAECQDDLMKFCRIRKAPVDTPFRDLPKKWQDWVVNGDPDYGKDAAHRWPRAWYGIKGYFRWLESKSYKMHVRVLLSRYRSYQTCPSCQGRRFQPDALLYKVARPPARGEREPSAITLSDFYLLPVRDALAFIEHLAGQRSLKISDPLALALGEVRARLGYLNDVGLGYLTLDRPTRTLSGGETERVNLTTCLGTRLVNTLFVLDEPSVGLHPRDTGRLVRIVQQLRDAGNTVVVVEHEASVMRAADQIIDLGPGHGAEGGSVVFQGAYADLLESPASLTGQYLSGARQIEIRTRRPVQLPGATAAAATRSGVRKQSTRPRNRLANNFGSQPTPALTLSHANLHNLKDLSVEIPLGRFVCLTGVSGSGKTTLARDVLLPLLTARLREPSVGSGEDPEKSESDQSAPDESSLSTRHSAFCTGHDSLGRVVLVDQSALGKTPRSNPAVYIGAFDDIRELFAQSDLAQRNGLNASAFSFNSAQGQCERCRGAGFEKIEMQFLSDVFVRCPDCNGRRYRQHIIDIKIAPPAGAVPEMSIADVLDATVDEAVTFLSAFGETRPARRAVTALELLRQVGLGYLRLGQPINTLSGGESQRLKLVRHLADFAQASGADTKPTLFLFDEPTTGLHFEDVRILLQVFQRLVDAGHTVLIIEHNLDVIKSVDWVIDLGPDAGDQGGEVVAQGTPEEIAATGSSHTGRALKEVLPGSPMAKRPGAQMAARP